MCPATRRTLPDLLYYLQNYALRPTHVAQLIEEEEKEAPAMTHVATSADVQDQHLASRNLAPLTRSPYLADLRYLVTYLAEHQGVADLALHAV